VGDSLKETVVILGESSFMNFSYLRQSLVRIPEISDVLQQAQTYWDQLRGVKPLDLNNSFYNTDEFFMIHPEYKNFLTDLVQFALYKRLVNQNFNIEYVFANVNVTRAHLLILNLQGLKEFVFKHPAVRSFNVEPKQVRSLHALHTHPKYSLFRLTSCGIKNIKTSAQPNEVFEEIETLQDKIKVLNLGLGQNLKFLNLLSKSQMGLISESILLDDKLKLIFETYVGLDSEMVVSN
jgi:hypothetical protein